MAHRDKDLFSAKELQQKLNIPDKYLRRLLTELSKNDLIKSIQGRNGGYILGRDLKKIYISDIVDVFETTDIVNSCVLGYEECAFDRNCSMHHVLDEVKEKLRKALTTTSLDDIMRN